MLVHFVCAGNTYRSRLAEALLRGYRLPAISASSSGVRASEDLNGPVSWYALRLLKRHDLIPFMTPLWTQTTAEILTASDLAIFMEAAVHEHCVRQYAFTGRPYEVWDVPDVGDPRYPEQQADPTDERRIMAITEATFARLQQEVAAFVVRHRLPATGAG